MPLIQVNHVISIPLNVEIYLIIYLVLAIAMQYTEAGYLLHSFRGKKMGHKLEAMVLQ